MSTLPRQSLRNVVYPETDGQPMAETDLHRDWMFRVLDILRLRYRKQRVYLASNLMVYYQEGMPHCYIVPDVFAVLDAKPSRRRTYKIWHEGKPPAVVFEITSKSTRREDESVKPRIYQQIGVKEYFLYDPTQDYLKPPLRGFRRDESGNMVELVAGKQRLLESQVLGITLHLDHDNLVMRDHQSGEVLLTGEEHQAQRALEARKRAQVARKRELEALRLAEQANKREADALLKQQQAEAKAAKLQATLDKLRRSKR